MSCFLPSVPPSIKDHGRDALSTVTVREGASVSLECESNAVPPPLITWYKSGRMVAASRHVQLLADRKILHIKKAEVRLWFYLVSGLLGWSGGSLEVADSPHCSV